MNMHDYIWAYNLFQGGDISSACPGTRDKCVASVLGDDKQFHTNKDPRSIILSQQPPSSCVSLTFPSSVPERPSKMFTTLISATLVSLLVAGVSADFTVVTPEIAQVSPTATGEKRAFSLSPFVSPDFPASCTMGCWANSFSTINSADRCTSPGQILQTLPHTMSPSLPPPTHATTCCTCLPSGRNLWLTLLHSVEFGEHNSSSLTWGAATLSAGKQVILSILDSDDNEAWSGTVRLLVLP